MSAHPVEPFTRYQKFLVAMLAFLQFTIILDFMIVSPLGAFLMPALGITAGQFGIVVSAYAFAAGVSGFLAAGFADRFDRKKLLLFFYVGFLAATLLCGLARDFPTLVLARVLAGVFGGVIGSIVLAIVADLFDFGQRGRAMGFVQTAFAASQVLGLPVGLYLSNHWGWHAPFMMIVVVGAVAGAVIFYWLRPIDGHLKMQRPGNPFRHLAETFENSSYVLAFATTALLSIGGFMLMPFGSAFAVNNAGIDSHDLPIVYFIVGVCSMAIGPLVGRACDAFGKFRTFAFGTALSILMVIIYTHLGITPLWLYAAVNVVMFIGIFSRMIPSQALMSAIPAPANRGAFMSVSSSLQQIAGGLASSVAGMLITVGPDGILHGMDLVGYTVCTTSLGTLAMMGLIARRVAAQGVDARG